MVHGEMHVARLEQSFCLVHGSWGFCCVARARSDRICVLRRALAVCEKNWTCVCAELGSTFELEHDLGCFEHVLTHSNRLVWFVLSETYVLKSRSDLPSPLR